MKKLFKSITALILALLFVASMGCTILIKTREDDKTEVPGQAKKIEDDKSAKDHAPGQEKKD